jgi:hypothetical protein
MTCISNCPAVWENRQAGWLAKSEKPYPEQKNEPPSFSYLYPSSYDASLVSCSALDWEPDRSRNGKK